MHIFIQELVNGLTQGSLYALIALGYSMVYGVLKLLNFAHGDLYMVGAFVGYFVIQWFGGPTALAIPVPLLMLVMFLLAGGGVGVLGVAIERFAYRPLRDAPRIAPLITALGVSFLLENTMLLLFGASFRDYNTSAFIPFSTGIHIGGVHISIVQIMVIVLSVVLMFGLHLLVNRTTARPADARGRRRSRGGRDARHQRRLHDLDDVLPRLGAGRDRRRDGRAGVQPDLHADGLHPRPQGVHRRGGRRDRRRSPARCSAGS